MNCIHPATLWRQKTWLCLAAFIVVTCAVFSQPTPGADSTSTNAAPAVVKKPAKSKAPKKSAPKLTGAELYQVNCNRCHPERYPTEFDSRKWKTLVMHMRVRANLPAVQAKEILKYLQEDSGN